MSTKIRCRLLAGVTLFALMIAAPGQAQSMGDASHIDDRFRNQVYHLSPDQKLSDALMTGQNDLLLLRKTQHVTVHAGYARSVTSNAPLSPDEPKKDGFGIADIGVEVSTTVAGRVKIYASANAVASKYDQYKALNYSAVTAAVGASAHVFGFDIDVAWSPSAVYGRDNFKKLSLKQARTTAALSTNIKLGPVILQPSVQYERTVAHPSDYDNSASGSRLTMIAPLKTKRPITLYVSAGVERRIYDHYFPDLLGVDRKDKLEDIAVGAFWQITPSLAVKAQYAYQRNQSTSDVSYYKARGGMVGVSLSRRI